MFHFGLKFLCDGYVTGRTILNQYSLIINGFLYDGYVISNLKIS